MKKSNVIDLFSGAGGLSLGAARAGFNLSGAVELDSTALKTHYANFPKTKHLELDVSKIKGAELLKYFSLSRQELDGIIGGPPCQGFSAIGKNQVSDPRNDLFVDFFRIVSEAKPKFFLAENVPGLMQDKNSAIREEAFSKVMKSYTLLPPLLISANDFGVPTVRKRFFFIGYLRDELASIQISDFKASKQATEVNVRKALKGLPKKINPMWQTEKDAWRVVKGYDTDYFGSRLNGLIPNGVGHEMGVQQFKRQGLVSGFLGTYHRPDICRRFSKVKPGEMDLISKFPRLDPNGFCPTIRAGTGSDRGSFQAVRPLHYSEDRVITPREAARLQGFPDWFVLPPTKWHSFRQIGNSVSPIVSEQILSVIKKAIL